MRNRTAMRAIIAAIVALASALAVSTARAEAKKPNIVVIMGG